LDLTLIQVIKRK